MATRVAQEQGDRGRIRIDEGHRVPRGDDPVGIPRPSHPRVAPAGEPGRGASPEPRRPRGPGRPRSLRLATADRGVSRVDDAVVTRWATWPGAGGVHPSLRSGRRAARRCARREGPHWDDQPSGRAQRRRSGWGSMGGSRTSIAVGQNKDGRLEILNTDVNGVTYHIWQQTGGGWSGFYALY